MPALVVFLGACMNHPMYEAGYGMVINLIDMGLQVQFYFWPFLILSLIIFILNWLRRRSQGGGADMADLSEEYVRLRGDLDRAPGRWRRRRDRW